MALKFEDARAQRLLADCLHDDGTFGVVFHAHPELGRNGMSTTGCMARIVEHTQDDDGTMLVLVRGLERFEVDEIVGEQPYFLAHTHPVTDTNDMPAGHPLLNVVGGLSEIYRELVLDIDPRMSRVRLPRTLEPSHSFQVIEQLLIPEEIRADALKTPSALERFQMAERLLQVEIQRLRFLMDEQDGEMPQAPVQPKELHS